MASDAVRCVQDGLSATAFSAGGVDGQWGRKTQASIEGLVAHLALPVDPVSQENAAALCDVLNTLSADQRRLATVASVPVTIDPADLAQLTGKAAYDFSGRDIDTDRTETCQFQIRRRAFHDDRRETLASGSINLVSGRVEFGPHSWVTGGLADSSYLAELANLAVGRDGRIYGTMPFFHMFVRPGEEAQPPQMVELGLKTKLDETGDPAAIWFDVSSWGDGFLQLYSCKPPS